MTSLEANDREPRRKAEHAAVELGRDLAISATTSMWETACASRGGSKSGFGPSEKSWLRLNLNGAVAKIRSALFPRPRSRA